MGGNDRLSCERLTNDTFVTGTTNMNDCTTDEAPVLNNSSASSPDKSQHRYTTGTKDSKSVQKESLRTEAVHSMALSDLRF